MKITYSDCNCHDNIIYLAGPNLNFTNEIEAAKAFIMYKYKASLKYWAVHLNNKHIIGITK